MKTTSPLAFVLAAVLASPAGGAARRYVDLPDHRPGAPYSDAVLVGDTLYLAGKIGVDPTTGKPPADAAEEAKLGLDHLRAVLVQAGLTMDDLVSVQVFCSDVAQYDAFNKVYRTYFTKELPARAFVGAGPLLYGARFEVQGIAVRR